MRYALVVIDSEGITASTFLSPDKEERIKEIHQCVDALLTEAEKLTEVVE